MPGFALVGDEVEQGLDGLVEVADEGGALRRREGFGLGSASQPFTGSVSNFLQQFLSVQANAAPQATQLQQGQSVVVSTLQAKFDSTSKVNLDSEMSNLIQLQNAYAANAHVMSVVQSMMNTLIQAQL